jgi:SAM-dependent methyltransferase
MESTRGMAGEYHDQDFDWATDLAPTAEAQLAAIPTMTMDAAEAEQYEGGGAAAWELFYKQHSRRGAVYQTRRYLPKAFPELLLLLPAAATVSNGGDSPFLPTVLLEVGCGLGSSLAAILECHPTVQCIAIDVSQTALQLLHAKLPVQHAARVRSFRCDVASEPAVLQAGIGIGGGGGSSLVDLALLVFTLSAIPPKQHVAVLRNLRAVMRPGSGLLLFRDYGKYDVTQLRSKRRLGERLFARQDGTLAFFFTPEYLEELLRQCGGWEVVACKYACVRNVNRGTGQVMHRVFLHAKARAVVPADEAGVDGAATEEGEKEDEEEGDAASVKEAEDV